MSFDLIIGWDGLVQCARIVSWNNDDSPPPRGLYDEIRRNLRRREFTPPMMHGQPVAVRLRMSEQVPCSE